MFGSFLAGTITTAVTNPFWILNAKMAMANVNIFESILTKLNSLLNNNFSSKKLLFIIAD